MGQPSQIEINRFVIRSKSGTTLTVIEWQKLVYSNQLSGKTRPINGSKFFSTINGVGVSQLKDGSFEVLNSEEGFWKV